MLTAIEIAKKYNVHFSLEHAWGATDYLDEIVESGCDICYGPIATYRSPGERRKIDVEAVKMLDDRGVNVNGYDQCCKSAGRRRPSGKPGRRKRCRYYCNERKTRT